MEIRITVQRTDGTIETITKPGRPDDATMEEARRLTREAGRGEILSWERIGTMPRRSATFADMHRMADRNSRICRCGDEYCTGSH